MSNRDKIRDIIVLAILLAMGIVLNILDSLIPMPFGLRLGLANIVGLFALYIFGYREALIVTILRILIASALRGTFGSITFFMALPSGIVAIAVMWLLKKFTPFGKIVISTIGALVHSATQIVVAVIIMESPGVFAMLPVMLLIAVATGILIGIISDRFIKIYDTAIKKQN